MLARRHFLKQLLLCTATPLAALNRRAFALDDSVTHRRLVLVELVGANDGLNTLVPYRNDHYYNLRPTLALHQPDIITIDQSLGVHASLEPLMPLWERGELAWVQGLGYPKANRSHFKSIALWQSAGDGLSARAAQGWLTHAVEHQLGRQVIDPHGISLAGDLGVFASNSGRWFSTESVEDLKKQQVPQNLNTQSEHPTLKVLQQRIATLDSTLKGLQKKLNNTSAQSEIPRFSGGALGEQLRQVCMMVAAGLDTPVYRVQLKGFDTHRNQQPRHQRLMKALAQALASFSKVMRQMGEWDNTLVMSYSEFGRRAAENRSAGTDHGTAAPHLVLGGSVVGGIYGDAPDLADLSDGDPLFTLDYRALYNRILVDGLGVSTAGSGTLCEYADARLEKLLRHI